MRPLRLRAPRNALLVLLALACAEGAASAHQHRRRLQAQAGFALAYRGPIPKLVMAEIVHPAPRPQLAVQPSYYEEHADRVQKDFLSFHSEVLGQNPAVHRAPPGAEAGSQLTFVAPSTAEDPLQQLRELDRLVLFRDAAPGVEAGAIAVGASMFATAVLGAAHAPAPLRRLFDGPIHLGPAIFQGGGMGAGAGATF